MYRFFIGSLIYLNDLYCMLICDLSNMQPNFDLALAVAGGVPVEPYTSELAVNTGCRPGTSSVIVNT